MDSSLGGLWRWKLAGIGSPNQQWDGSKVPEQSIHDYGFLWLPRDVRAGVHEIVSML